MTDHDDLTWLADRQPRTASPDAETTASARTALLEHADPAAPPLAFTAPARASRRPAPRGPRRRGVSGRRVLSLAGVAAVAAVGVVAVAGGLPTGDGGGVLAPPPAAEAAPLVRLSHTIAAAPAAPGDATLVVRRSHVAGDKTVTAYDLYLDNGRYYFSASPDGLKHSTAQEVPGGANMTQKLAAAAAAVNLPGDAARLRMAQAGGPPGFPDHMGEDTAAGRAAGLDEKTMAAGRRTSAELRQDPAHRAQMIENNLWGNTVDTLTAAAGRADVRAGVMKLLATSSTVKVAPATADGRDVLDITETGGFGDTYAETLTVDATTGVLTHLTGREPGKPASVDVDYDVKRVTAADVLGG
jgi:hypothetical protein